MGEAKRRRQSKQRIPEIEIPGRFWKTLTEAEFHVLFENGGFLNAEQCARLWRMADRNTEPPQEMEVFVNTADLIKIGLLPARK